MIFDREDGCWLPAGLDSDTFPIFADRPLVGGAVPFGSHVSRRPGRAGSAGRGVLRELGVGSVPESRGFSARGGGERAGLGSGEAEQEVRASRRGNALRSRVSEGLERWPSRPGKHPPTTRGSSAHLLKDSLDLKSLHALGKKFPAR